MKFIKVYIHSERESKESKYSMENIPYSGIFTIYTGVIEIHRLSNNRTKVHYY